MTYEGLLIDLTYPLKPLQMASGTKEKGLTANEPTRVQKKLGISESRNGLKEFETWMDTGYQLCQKDSLKFLEEIKKWMPENASQLCSKVFEGFETDQQTLHSSN